MNKQKIYSICGVLWFIMDIFWYYKLMYPAFIMGVLTAISAFVGMRILSIDESPDDYITAAVFSWILLNLCSLIREMYPTPQIEKLTDILGLLFTIIGVVCLIVVGFKNKRLFENFKRL